MANKQDNYLYNCDQVRTLDRLAIDRDNISGLQLMQRAGMAVFKHILQHYRKHAVTVFCGSGNNGGDGYVIATLAKEKGIAVQLIHLKQPQQLKGNAKRAYEIANKAGVTMVDFSPEMVLEDCIIVDALIGIGLKGSVRGTYCDAIELINNSNLVVVAVDLPSGLNADTGDVENICVKAQTTICFIGLKQGLFTNHGPDYCGKIIYQDLAEKSTIFDEIPPVAIKLQLSSLLRHLKPRQASSHKNNYGHVIVVGGDYGYAGASLLAAEAALRTGAGLVSVATRQEHISLIVARRPEIMAHAVDSSEALQTLLKKASVLIIGPGLGQSLWSRKMLNCALKADIPSILDADALNLVAREQIQLSTMNHPYIFTPHPKEAARLLNVETAQIQKDRFSAVKKMAKKYHAQVLLKGTGSLVCVSANSTIGVCTSGNPGMATGGMGDVLSGIIGGLLAQGVNHNHCLALATCLHAEAADMAAKARQ
jgi:NAD(P)H-hydrate epimerase